MTSWRDVLRQRQLAIDAADREEFQAKQKPAGISCSLESIDSDSSYRDVSQISMLSSPCTEPAAVHLVVSDVPEVQSPTSDDNLKVDRDCKNVPDCLEQPATRSIDARRSSADNREVESVDSSSAEVRSDQLSPADGGDLTEELKSDAGGASDGASLDSFGGIESDAISSGVVDSSKSVASTPEHLASTDVSFAGNASLNCVSEGRDSTDEVPKPATPVDLSLEPRSPVHKRTRRHGRRHGARHAGRKDELSVEPVDYVPDAERRDDVINIEPAGDVRNIRREVERRCNSEPSDDVHLLTPVPAALDGFQSQPSDVEMLADADDMSTQVVRHPSYLKAVSTAGENPVPEQSSVAASTAAKSSDEDYLVASTAAEAW